MVRARKCLILAAVIGAIIGGCSTKCEAPATAVEKESTDEPTLPRGDSPFTIIFTKTGGFAGVNEGFIITTSKDSLERFNKTFKKSEAYVLPESTAQAVFTAAREYGFFSFKSVESTSVEDSFHMSLILELPSNTNQVFWTDTSGDYLGIQRIGSLVQKLENLAKTNGTKAALGSNK
jgi:hypothetical protein